MNIHITALTLQTLMNQSIEEWSTMNTECGWSIGMNLKLMAVTWSLEWIAIRGDAQQTKQKRERILTSESAPLSTPGQSKLMNSWQRLWTTSEQAERKYQSRSASSSLNGVTGAAEQCAISSRCPCSTAIESLLRPALYSLVVLNEDVAVIEDTSRLLLLNLNPSILFSSSW